MSPDDARTVTIDAAPALTVDEIADRCERLRAAAASYRRRAVRLTEQLREAEALLTSRLAPDSGEVAASAEGRIAYVETAPSGPASVDEEALRRHADSLAGLGLAPVEQVVTVYPGVVEIRQAEAALRGLGLEVRELLEEAPRGPVLRWRQTRSSPVYPPAE